MTEILISKLVTYSKLCKIVNFTGKLAANLILKICETCKLYKKQISSENEELKCNLILCILKFKFHRYLFESGRQIDFK